MADTLVVPETHRDLFTSATVALSTLNADGSIQTTAIWALLGEDGVLRTSLSKNRHKYKNLAARPTATVFAISPTNPYHTAEIRATAIIEDDADKSFLVAMLATYGRTLEQFGSPGLEPRVVVTFQATRVRAGN
ncbi:pyridoxamine 5'-phosphate oxidase family protein [Frankia sp. CNm7]|uniref:Pyridoxamine 5'-phosphate oxidase family protein n=1 Tax=Frankia nepalensis TaxID=1836974 RepID=A0A937UNZ7_9ACTN|nr:pyridoxamine 5'-phosphate oxidase family protein [Frankia nepalensis]MBL7500092.1 pyridoxamine 5'-phosphate oxidase family protein [Frankia nepalensis]MBL7512451.1 pyridoxamine 5'-phosphate oxidase family protein [Frankia nepalensis]MBL7523746.1 pyridoxamine 5'-phosphate oxidase family protein [Frankia nepalensis]MBL7628588.1 pyridoxamine 5'-phosphate oxidase family protein [Frankia nepalensis]